MINYHSSKKQNNSNLKLFFLFKFEMGKGGKKPRKNVKKPKKLKVPGQSDKSDPDSALATPDVDAYVHQYGSAATTTIAEPRGYPTPTTYNTDEIYIPMKVFQFNTFIEISERARTDYGYVF